MQNRLQAANPAVAQTAAPHSHPLISQEWGPTVSAVSASLSILALLISGGALWNTRKSARQTSFDNHYGNSIRDGLRDLEEVSGRLRAYAFPSKPLPELKNEIPDVQAEIEDTAFKVGNLLAEVDGSRLHKCTGWALEFEAQLSAAGLRLESSTNASVSNEMQFRQRVEAARDLYRTAISAARTKLERVRTKA